MENTFIPVTITFILFACIAYYLNVLRMSIPLVMIYLIYCFSYFINETDDLDARNSNIVNKNIEDRTIAIDKLKSSNSNDSSPKILEQKISQVPKPIVSFAPKPIVIDSNQKIIKKMNDSNFASNKSNENINIEQINIDEKNNLKLNEIMICRGIYKRNPIKPGNNFINNVDSLFCYTKISNSGSKQEVKHIWYYENKEVTTVSYNIKTSYNYRSWSKKTISPNQIGRWKVEVVDKYGDILGSRDFKIDSINSNY